MNEYTAPVLVTSDLVKVQWEIYRTPSGRLALRCGWLDKGGKVWVLQRKIRYYSTCKGLLTALNKTAKAWGVKIPSMPVGSIQINISHIVRAIFKGEDLLAG